VGTRCADHVTPLYPQKLALTSPTGGGRSFGIVRVRTKATEFVCLLITTDVIVIIFGTNVFFIFRFVCPELFNKLLKIIYSFFMTGNYHVALTRTLADMKHSSIHMLQIS